jgi:hypothetical protein
MNMVTFYDYSRLVNLFNYFILEYKVNLRGKNTAKHVYITGEVYSINCKSNLTLTNA